MMHPEDVVEVAEDEVVGEVGVVDVGDGEEEEEGEEVPEEEGDVNPPPADLKWQGG